MLKYLNRQRISRRINVKPKDRLRTSRAMKKEIREKKSPILNVKFLLGTIFVGLKG
jgi:hypothetical protein